MESEPHKKLFLQFEGNIGEARVDKVMISSIKKGKFFSIVKSACKCISDVEYMSKSYLFDLNDGFYQLCPHVMDTEVRRKIPGHKGGFGRPFKYISIQRIGDTMTVDSYLPVPENTRKFIKKEVFDLKTQKKL